MSPAFAAAVLAVSLGAEPSVTSPLTVSARSGFSLSLTSARTQGGVGGGLGLGYALTPSMDLFADASWLWGLGSVGLVRAGAGWHRTGLWTPQLSAMVELGVGGGLDFSVAGKTPSRLPTVGLSLGLAPLRFTRDGAWISLFELSGGLSTEFLAVGPRFGVTALAVGAPW